MWQKLRDNKKAIIISLLILAHLWRFNQLPVSFHPDEKIYLVNAAVLSQFGTDLTGNWRPWQLRPFDGMFAELPSAIHALGFFISSDPFIAGRIFPLFLGLGAAWLLAILSSQLTGRRSSRWPVLLAALANPWLWQLTRTSFDPIFSLFFYLLGLVLMFSKSKWRWLAPLSLALGFYQYQGLKVIFLPIVLSTAFYHWWSTTKRKKSVMKYTAFVALTATALFSFYLLISLPKQTAASRVSGDTIFSEKFRTELGQAVGDERRIVLTNPFTNLFSNKLSVGYFQLWQKWVELIRLDYMFVSNDPSISGFSVWSHGLFYPIDILLMILGLTWIWRKKQNKLVGLLLFWLLLGSLPSFISTTNPWFIFRLSWLYVTMILLIGLGIERITLAPKSIKYGFSLIYFLLILNFGYQFFFRYPVYATNGNRLYERLVAEYLGRVDNSQPIRVITSEPKNQVNSFLLYNWPQLNKSEISTILENYRQENWQVGQIKFEHQCLSPDLLYSGETLLVFNDITWCDKVVTDEVMQKQFDQHRSISSILDAGEQVRIFNDQLCEYSLLARYPTVSQLNQFDLKKLSPDEFCAIWIQDLKTGGS